MATATALLPRAGERPLPSLTSNFLWTLGGTVIYNASQWGMLSLLVKRGTPETVGVFALGLAVSAPVFMLCNLQLRGVQATDSETRYSFADFFMLRSACTVAALIILCCVCAVANYSGEVLTVVVALSAAKAFESWSDVIAGLLQKRERLDLAARAVSLRGLASLLVFALVFTYTHKLSAACIALAATWAAVVCVYDVALARTVLRDGESFVSRSTDRMGELLLKSLPLGVVMMLSSFNANLPRYVVAHDLGTGELGIFASLAYLLTAVSLLSIALGQAATARMAVMWAAGELERFQALVAKLEVIGAGIGIAACAGAMAVGKPLLTLIYGQTYSSHQRLLLLLAATAGVSTMATFMGFAATAAQSFSAQVLVITGMTLTTLALSWVLVPRLGLLGAGVALLISAVVQFAGLTAITCNAIRTRRERI